MQKERIPNRLLAPCLSCLCAPSQGLRVLLPQAGRLKYPAPAKISACLVATTRPCWPSAAATRTGSTQHARNSSATWRRAAGVDASHWAGHFVACASTWCLGRTVWLRGRFPQQFTPTRQSCLWHSTQRALPGGGHASAARCGGSSPVKEAGAATTKPGCRCQWATAPQRWHGGYR